MKICNAVINVLQQKPSKVGKDCMTCLITNLEHTKHKLHDSQILNNIEHLCSSYIKACITARCAINLQKTTHFNKLKTNKRIESMSVSQLQDSHSLPSPKDSTISQILCIIDEGAKKDFQ